MAKPEDDRAARRDGALADQNAARETVETASIPLVEEAIAIERRVGEGRTVTVSTRPVTEEIAISEPVSREEVTIERIPVGLVVDHIPETREEGDLTIVPVIEERLRVVRELVLVEEIHLRRTRTERLHKETVTTIRTEVDIDG